jgi:CBS domain containing-hemolysin-like protein
VSGSEVRLAILALLLVMFAALLAAAESAVAKISRSRAAQLAEEGRSGSTALLTVVGASARYQSVSTFVRVVCESFAAVFVTITCAGLFERRGVALGVAAGVMVLASFVLVGVSPRTLGRQHAETAALACAPLLVLLARLLGPVARLLVTLGNAVTPGKGYRDGPFNDEAELRDLVDLAGENAVIEADERQMLHSVFELGDTIVRGVMVPRTDMASSSTTRCCARRCRCSAVRLLAHTSRRRRPDDVLGVLYLKDVSRRIFSDCRSRAERAGARPDASGALRAREQAGRRPAARDAAHPVARGDRRRRVRRHRRLGHHRGRPRGDRR